MPKTVMNAARRETFAGWVREHTDDLLRFCRSRVKDPAVAEDLVQISFIAAWETMDRFSGDSSVRTWLFAIMKHKLADHYRKVYREAAALSGSATDVDLLENDLFENTGHWKLAYRPEGDFDAFREEDDKERMDRALRHCMDALPPHWRSAVEMKYLLNNDSAAIQEALGLSETNYWQQIHRAKLKLRQCIQQRMNNKTA